MQRAISTHQFSDDRLTIALLDRIQKAGIPAVEIFCGLQHIDWRNRSQITEIGFWLRDSPLKVCSMHSPMYNDEYWGRSGADTAIAITESVKARRTQMVDEIKRALEIAETIPFRYLIQHVGVAGEPYSERAVDAAFNSLEELKLFAGHRGVEILLENIPNDLSSAERLLMFLNQTHLELGICFDTGHAHMHEGVANAYKMLKAMIRSTHVHDNNGKEDAHQHPFGTSEGIDWPETMTLLRSAGDQYPLLLELKRSPLSNNSLDDVLRIFDRLEALREEDPEEREERRRLAEKRDR